MKKIISAVITAALAVMIPAAAYAAVGVESAQPLKFTEAGGGTFIYSNNHEAINREHLADKSNPTPEYIMNNYGLEKGKYAMYVSHLNRTDILNDDGTVKEEGFDIEADAQFKALSDTKITFTAAGMSSAGAATYYENGVPVRAEDNWGCINAVADYMQRPIREQFTGREYIPGDFKAVTITIKKGESFYLSEIIDNYTAVTWLKPVQLLADFEILSGKADVNVLAVKSNGTLGDRSELPKEIAHGKYHRDRCHLGISKTLPAVYSDKLSYTIDDTVLSGTYLPVTVYNQFVPSGNTVTSWATNLNPQTDMWSKAICAESDLIKLEYYDPSKLDYYGKNIKKNEKSDTWYFDSTHSDTAEWIDGCGVKKEDYKPNYELSTEGNNDEYGCHLGNYGVSTNYRVEIKNTSAKTRYFNYLMNAYSNYLVNIKDEKGNYVGDYTLAKGTTDERTTDVMACVELPAGKTTSFVIEVILPMNGTGGVFNSFMITDLPYNLADEEKKADTVKTWQIDNQYFTGSEYYKWEDGDILTTKDGVNWTAHKLNDTTKKIFDGRWYDFKIQKAGNGYMAKAYRYQSDELSYYTNFLQYYSDVYTLDANFNVTGQYQFGEFPTDATYAKNRYFIRAGGKTYFSYNGNHWRQMDTEYSMPVDNGGFYAAAVKDGEYYVTENGEDFKKIVYPGAIDDGEQTVMDPPLYIDVIGDYYYYIDGRNLYLSKNAVSWTKKDAGENIYSLDYVNGEILANGKKVDKSLIDKRVMSIGDTVLSLSEEIMRKDQSGTVMAPARLLAYISGSKAAWDGERRRLVLYHDGDMVEYYVGQQTAKVNSTAVTIGAAPYYEGPILYLPLYEFADQLDYTIREEDGVMKFISNKIYGAGDESVYPGTMPAAGVITNASAAKEYGELLYKNMYNIKCDFKVYYNDISNCWELRDIQKGVELVLRASDGGVVSVRIG